jgi:hypothetical protein
MAIKLPKPEHKTIEQLKAERFEQYAPVAKKLRDGIEAACQKVRTEYETTLYDRMFARVEEFITTRKSNETCDEFYRRKFDVPKDYRPNHGSREDKRQWVREACAFVVPLTDHWQRPLYDAWNYDEWGNNPNRTDFGVKMLDTTPGLLRAKAKAEFNSIIGRFSHKVAEKILDILVANQEYECTFEKIRVAGGIIEADVKMRFASTKFTMHISLKYNQSMYGTPYIQYPLTFHDFETVGQATTMSFASENEVLKAMGLEPWKPSKSKKPWDTIHIGDIVELKDGELVIVAATRAPTVKVFAPGYGQRDKTVDDIKFIHARTKVMEETDPERTHRHDDAPWHEKMFYVLRVEMFNERVQRFRLDKKYNAELKAEDSYTKRDGKVRLLGFSQAKMSWENLMVPPEPKKVVRRRRWR